MTSSADSSRGDSGSSPQPLIDKPLEGLMDWDNPFRQTYVAGSDWAPWLTTARFPPPSPASDEDYGRYRRDYQARLDAAYAEWKRHGRT